MISIHDETSCKSAGTRLKKTMKNFMVQSGQWGTGKPKGCSWHNAGNVELWESSSGDCDNGYHGCFCLNIQGKESIFLILKCYILLNYKN